MRRPRNLLRLAENDRGGLRTTERSREARRPHREAQRGQRAAQRPREAQGGQKATQRGPERPEMATERPREGYTSWKTFVSISCRCFL